MSRASDTASQLPTASPHGKLHENRPFEGTMCTGAQRPGGGGYIPPPPTFLGQSVIFLFHSVKIAAVGKSRKSLRKKEKKRKKGPLMHAGPRDPITLALPRSLASMNSIGYIALAVLRGALTRRLKLHSSRTFIHTTGRR